MPRHYIIARDPLIIAEAVEKLLGPAAAVEKHHAADLDLETIFNQLGTADLFAAERCFQYIDFLDFKLLSKKDSDRLAAIFAKLPAETTLVCTQVLEYATRGEETKALNGQTYKRWTLDAPVTDLRQLSEGSQAVNWLKQRARQRYNLDIGPNQLTRLLNANDDRPALVDGELKKLWMLRSEGQAGQVADAEITAIISQNPGARFYELVDAILGGNPQLFRKLGIWYSAEPETYRLVNELKRRFLGLLALSRGEQVMPPFLANQLRNVQRRWPGPRLALALRGLAELEYNLKSGRTTGETSKAGEFSALQLYLAGLARG
ncbi:hypothetical protein JW859_00570 [bacterium]|nr:hypothetical protein [bacterium]